MSKNTYFTYYAKLNDTEELEIEVSYSLGDQSSWWDGKPRPRGLKVRMTPVTRYSSDGFSGKQFTIGDDRGRSFHVVDLKRRSDKQGERLAQYVKKHIDDIASAGVARDWQSVSSILFDYA